MGYWTGDDLPFYHSMARRFPIGDRYFCSVMAQTYPNRRFLIAGTALGDISTDASGISKVDAPNGTIFDRLNHYGISWKDYYAELPTCALFEPVLRGQPRQGGPPSRSSSPTPHRATFPPSASSTPTSTTPRRTGTSRWARPIAALVVDAVMQGPAWDRTALIWVYDEHGGWYDHVPPKRAVKPDNVPPELLAGDLPGAYNYTGFRVPCCVVSAWSKKDYVSHQTFDHTSILKLVETKWNLPALTYRDANARNMLDFFDFTAKRPPFADPPALHAPKNPFSSPAALPPARSRPRTWRCSTPSAPTCRPGRSAPLTPPSRHHRPMPTPCWPPSSGGSDARSGPRTPRSAASAPVSSPPVPGRRTRRNRRVRP